MFAEIMLQSPYDRIELIAHEIEHVIEQLEGVKLRTTACEMSRNPPGVYESCRAVEAGRRVAREVEEARARRATASSEGSAPGKCVLEIDEGIGRPQPLAESLTSDEFAWLFEQRLQNLNRLVGNPEAGWTFVQLALAHIELERPETDGTAGRNPIVHSGPE